MEQTIRHRRLYAFYRSKALNSLMILIYLSLIMALHTRNDFFLMCAAGAGVLFVGYALWIWIARPRRIAINDWLSNVSGLYFIYFLAVPWMKTPNPWWYIAPALIAIPLLFIFSLNLGDEDFEVKPRK
ncbi:MAG: hypothetical protein K2L21_07340 [Muribaculaceae bacterium]|nr:hypothetical protein [Muribaculaceae bacterium]